MADQDLDRTRDELMRALRFASPATSDRADPAGGFSARAWARVANELSDNAVAFGPDDIAWLVAGTDEVVAVAGEDGLTIYRLAYRADRSPRSLADVEHLGSYDADRVVEGLVALYQELDGEEDRAERRQLEASLPELGAVGDLSSLIHLRRLAEAKRESLPLLYRALLLVARQLYPPGDPVLAAHEKAVAAYRVYAERDPGLDADAAHRLALLAASHDRVEPQWTDQRPDVRGRLLLAWMNLGTDLARARHRRLAIAANRAALRGWKQLRADDPLAREYVVLARSRIRAQRWLWLAPAPRAPTESPGQTIEAEDRPVPPPGWTTTAPILVATASLVVGVVAWLLTGHGRWALLGTASAAAWISGAMLYRAARGFWPRRFSSIEGGYADGADVAAGWLPEAVVLVAVVLPSVVGAAVAASADDWRWAVTGMTVGALAPVVGVLVATVAGADRVAAGMELGQVAVAVLVVAAGLPIALLAWMWSGDAAVFLAGAGSCVGLALLTLLFAGPSV